MRVRAAKLTNKKKVIEWRSHEPSRLETFSDAIFAFAITLVILSIEIPKSFTELFEMMKGTVSFAACFAALFAIWNNQNRFFRYYGLNDAVTVTLNGVLLFFVLVYVYPLKFLFNLMIFDNTSVSDGKVTEMIDTIQIPVLMTLYGAGYTIINLLFYLMHLNALKYKSELKLNEIEQYETKTTAWIYLICTLIGLTAILLAWLMPLRYSGYSGFFYSSIGLAYYVWYTYRGKRRKKIFGATELHLA